nr:hypothetical protein BaRGS_030897 [Batillaria attramentaria]
MNLNAIQNGKKDRSASLEDLDLDLDLDLNRSLDSGGSSHVEVELRRKDGNDEDDADRGPRVVSRAGMYERTLSHFDETDHRATSVVPSDYEFQFENLVFEGGGNKGLAYCGAVRYLEELGVMPNIKRFAGASAGGMMAALLAVGYNSYEVEQFLGDRIDKIFLGICSGREFESRLGPNMYAGLFLDASCGYCSLLPNLLSTFGWNPGRRIYEWFGDKLKAKTGNADITFKQMYQQMDKMVCIVVTNLSQMATEYCHPKTTPEMPIRVAVRMSMAIPGMFSAMKYEQFGRTDVYVDGGVLCNYPIHCFDGWYLSMAPEDSFVRKLQPLKDIPFIMDRNNRFDTFNIKTLGMLLYADGEEDILRYRLERRAGCLDPKKPQHPTKLYQ